LAWGRRLRAAVEDKVFSSGLSIALYILPAVFAGIAVNLVSHIFSKHLDEAELEFQQEKGPSGLL